MELSAEFEETCERYLLGDLSEAEREQFEEAYFADDLLFEQLQAVRDELLDAYARGELAAEKRKRFEAHFLSSAPNRGQLEETRKFIRAVTEVSTRTADPAKTDAPASNESRKSDWLKPLGGFFSPRRFAWQAAFAVLLLLVLGGIWLLVRSGQPLTTPEIAGRPTPLPSAASPTNENDSTGAANKNSNSGMVNKNAAAPSPPPVNRSPENTDQLPENTNQMPVNTKPTPSPTPKTSTVQPPSMTPAQIASVVLMPVATRSVNQSNTLRLNPDTRSVRLGLVFRSGDYRRYNASVTTLGGATVWRQNNLKSTNKSLTLEFAPAILRGQDYIVTLSGITPDGQTETIGEYYFRVERSPK